MSEGITLIRKINVRSIVTEALKKELQLQVDKALADIEKHMQALDEAEKVASGDRENSKEERLMDGIRNERVRLENRRREIENKGREYAALRMGDRFLQGTLDSFVEVKLGDILPEKLGGAEIVVNDGEIIEINSA